MIKNVAALFCLLAFLSVTYVNANEITGSVSAEARIFKNDPMYDDQETNSFSFAAKPEYYHEFEDGSNITFAPFARYDSVDSNRTHYDIRELNYLLLTDHFEFRIGVGKVFWGVTEFVHLVDIINQTDSVDSFDGEEKLGQPMAHLSVPTENWGVFDIFALPFFRERTFPGEKGRLRTPLVVDVDNATYEDNSEEKHFDFAVRYSKTLGDFDFGISYFRGTGREPTLVLGLDEDNQPVLIPHYEQINQTSIDVQGVLGEWLLKLEAIYRAGQGDENYYALTTGVEYTIVGIFETKVDLGIVGEWAYDERGDEATTAFENDAMFAFRFTLNDMASTEILAGISQDLDSSASVLSVEASRRFGDNLRATLEARGFIDIPEDDPMYSIKEDDFVGVEFELFF